MTNNETLCREAFERWWGEKPIPTPDGYLSDTVHNQWLAFQGGYNSRAIDPVLDRVVEALEFTLIECDHEEDPRIALCLQPVLSEIQALRGKNEN